MSFSDLFGLPAQPLWAKAVWIGVGYGLTLALSGKIVGFFVGPKGPPPEKPSEEEPRSRFDSHTVIGKCENLVTLTFILAGDLTGLALIFAAKSLVRSEDIHRSPRWYLGGTLVNFVWSLAMGYATRLLVVGPGVLS
jgi:hypothetical protein